MVLIYLQWHPTPVLLPGKYHGWRSLEGCSPWGHWGSDTTERLHFHFSLSCIGEGNGNPLQCSCLENPRDGGAWWAAVHWVAQSRTQLKRLSSSNVPAVTFFGILFHSIIFSSFNFYLFVYSFMKYITGFLKKFSIKIFIFYLKSLVHLYYNDYWNIYIYLIYFLFVLFFYLFTLFLLSCNLLGWILFNISNDY